jgi:hypothetical protein
VSGEYLCGHACPQVRRISRHQESKMRRKPLQTLILCLLIALAAAPIGLGQVVGAILSGSILDPSGAVIPAAKVTIRNISTGVVTQVLTNPNGIYNATNLLPGDYQVNVVAVGFAPQQRTGLTLTVGEKQLLNMQLKVGDAATTTFEVSNDAPSVELGSNSVSVVVGGDTARELPLNGRDWTQLFSPASIPSVRSPMRTA